MDFTIYTYKKLLSSLLVEYKFSNTFYEFLEGSKSDSYKVQNNSLFILRHDVDYLPENALTAAKLEHSLEIVATYYFRIIPETFKPNIIKEIAGMGHEIGYHYEDMDLVIANNLDRHIDLAYESFQRNLERLRKIVPIKTICMHGSPTAKYDNKLIWSKYNYRELGIIGEPYFDIDWNEFGYLTDTGRCWNGEKYSVRDRVNSKYKFNFKTTQDIIDNISSLPDKIMITIHPQRWTDNWLQWSYELVSQKIKNIAKVSLIKLRS